MFEECRTLGHTVAIDHVRNWLIEVFIRPVKKAANVEVLSVLT